MTKSQIFVFILINKRMSFPLKMQITNSIRAPFGSISILPQVLLIFCINYHIGRSCAPAESLACKSHAECRSIYVAADLALL